MRVYLDMCCYSDPEKYHIQTPKNSSSECMRTALDVVLFHCTKLRMICDSAYGESILAP